MFMHCVCCMLVGPSSTVSVYLQVMNFQVVNTKFGIPMVTVKKHTSPSLHQVSRQLPPALGCSGPEMTGLFLVHISDSLLFIYLHAWTDVHMDGIAASIISN